MGQLSLVLVHWNEDRMANIVLVNISCEKGGGT